MQLMQKVLAVLLLKIEIATRLDRLVLLTLKLLRYIYLTFLAMTS